jgi:chemotaxis protein CheD
MTAILRHGDEPGWRTHAPSGIVHTLHPGDVVCADQGDRLETLLGSCIAVILTDPRRTVGAMCHIVYSTSASHATARTTAHADMALDAMFDQLQQRGIVASCCHAYVYGGGNMFPGLVMDTHVGDTNASWTLNALASAGIPVLQQQTGGVVYRRVSWTVGPDDPRVIAVPI